MPYLDLCNEYKASRDLFFKSHDDASNFASMLFDGLKQYLKLSDDEHDLIKLIPNIPTYVDVDNGNNGEEIYSPCNEDTFYTPHGAVKLGENGYWSFSILLRLHIDGNKNMQPAENIKYNIFYKKINSIIYFRYIDDGEDIQVEASQIQSFLKKNTFKAMEKTILDLYKKEVNLFLHDRTIERKIGLIH